jgi:hypothetical protein
VSVSPALAEIVDEVDVLTELVLSVKVALLAPVATVMLTGTVTAALLLDRVTTTPGDGAAALRVTVPWDELPPTTLVGFNVNELITETVVTESGAVSVTPA